MLCYSFICDNVTTHGGMGEVREARTTASSFWVVCLFVYTTDIKAERSPQLQVWLHAKWHCREVLEGKDRFRNVPWKFTLHNPADTIRCFPPSPDLCCTQGLTYSMSQVSKSSKGKKECCPQSDMSMKKDNMNGLMCLDFFLNFFYFRKPVNIFTPAACPNI